MKHRPFTPVVPYQNSLWTALLARLTVNQSTFVLVRSEQRIRRHQDAQVRSFFCLFLSLFFLSLRFVLGLLISIQVPRFQVRISSGFCHHFLIFSTTRRMYGWSAHRSLAKWGSMSMFQSVIGQSLYPWGIGFCIRIWPRSRCSRQQVDFRGNVKVRHRRVKDHFH